MIDHIDELIEAGIRSLKIEGRVKSSYYPPLSLDLSHGYRRLLCRPGEL